MVLGLLSAVAACPAIIGTTEAVKHGQNANAREQHRGRKCNLLIELPSKNPYSVKFDRSLVVLKDNKFYIQHADSRFPPGSTHPFAGYFLPYPDNQVKWETAGFRGEGLVTTVNADNHLNWVYVDRRTHEVKHGVKAEAKEHWTGPWDVTRVDKRMTFDAWEGFVAVQEDDEQDLWALYFDKHGDGLSGKSLVGDAQAKGRRYRMLEVQLLRKERPQDLESRKSDTG